MVSLSFLHPSLSPSPLQHRLPFLTPFPRILSPSLLCSPSTTFTQTIEQETCIGRKKLQQQALLEQLALELERKKPSDSQSTPTVRALTWALSEVEEVSDVETLLQGLQFPLPVFSSVIQKLGSRKKVEAAFSVYQWLQTRDLAEERPNVYIYGSILGVIKTSGSYDLIGRVLGEMKKNGVEPNLVTYNTIICLYEQQGLHSEATSAFAELEQKGLIPNSFTYRTLLRGFEKYNDLQGALRLYAAAKVVLQETGTKEMVEELKAIVSAFCSRTVRSWLLANKEPHCILHRLQVMEDSLEQLCPYDYEEILWSCGTGEKDHIVVKAIYTRRRMNSLPMRVPLCNHVIRVLGKGKKWWAALEVFEHMTEEGPQPDKETYAIVRSHFNFLLNANASRKKINSNWSLKLLEKMEAHGILPDRFAWDTALVTCVKTMDSAAAVLVFRKMIERGQHPSILSYGALLSALEKGGFLEKAEQVWDHMKKLGVKPTIQVYTIMISVYGGSGKQEDLMRLVDEMRASGIQFTWITYNSLITACAKAGNGKGALDWMKQMQVAGINPDSTTYNQLVKALSQEGQAELARDMYIKANKLQLVLSPSAYDSVIEVCRIHNVKVDIDAMGSRPFPQGV